MLRHQLVCICAIFCNKLARAKVHCVMSFPKFHYRDLLPLSWQLCPLWGTYAETCVMDFGHMWLHILDYHTIKLQIKVPSKLFWAPGCFWETLFMWDPASIRSFTVTVGCILSTRWPASILVSCSNFNSWTMSFQLSTDVLWIVSYQTHTNPWNNM